MHAAQSTQTDTDNVVRCISLFFVLVIEVIYLSLHFPTVRKGKLSVLYQHHTAIIVSSYRSVESQESSRQTGSDRIDSADDCDEI